ncbi:MAG TPA: HlyD family efflux transporter periplasmic adaptor subunit [Bryobacteraceae bacterium]|nr:HlyD family efflux transporter periplasmic adaptor subunit [Bryobacteraceae bacterium]
MFPAVALVFLLAGCNRSSLPPVHAASAPGPEQRIKREIRITGLIQAVHSVKVTVPQIQGQYSMMTLTQLVTNGAKVKEGDLIATFDPTQQQDAARDARAKFDDLQHQIAQKQAEVRASAASRAVDLKSAQADLDKATLELVKGDTVADVIKVKNQINQAAAKAHVASLTKSGALHDKADASSVHVLELQRDRQQIYIERASDNIQRLQVRAPQSGMVVYDLTYRAGSMGHAQVGDQIYRGYPLLSIFDPSEMRVRCSISEPDILALLAHSKATVYLDAYPDVAIPARFEYSSPVASSALGTPIKTFLASFTLTGRDPHLMPDLSAAVVLEPLGGSQ